MNEIGALTGELLDYIERYALNGNLQQVKAVREFSRAAREFPLRSPVVVAGIEAVEVRESGLGNFWGNQSGTDAAVYGRSAHITVGLKIYAPGKKAGDLCREIWESLCSALLLQDCPFGFLRVSAGSLVFDPETGANRLTAKAEMRTAVTGKDTSLRVIGFDVRKEETHADYKLEAGGLLGL